jgi:hypothetical protein
MVRPKGNGQLEVQGLAKKIAIAPNVESLEANRTATPMSPMEPGLRELAGRLVRPGERLPLVIGSYQEGAFRCSSALWVSAGELLPVNSIKDLINHAEAWDGHYPDPDQWRNAEITAAQASATEVRRLLNAANEREQASLVRQIKACRQRLMKELGRYLVCIDGSTADLNGVFHRQMSRDIAGAKRLQICRERLKGYPEWPTGLCQELDAFYATLTEGQTNARLLGSEVDAALGDPRWAVLPG